MKILIELIGLDLAHFEVNKLKKEHPNMDEDWYVRQVIKAYA